MSGTDSFGYPPMGLSREEAARYIGIGSTKFDQLVKDGRMPRPKRIDGRKIWIRTRLDAAVNELPEDGDGGNAIDEALRKFGRR